MISLDILYSLTVGTIKIDIFRIFRGVLPFKPIILFTAISNKMVGNKILS